MTDSLGRGINRRRLLTLGGATAGAAFLAACGDGGGSGASSGKKITYWVPPNAELGKFKAYLDGAKQGFEKANSGSTVSNVVVPWEDGLTKYTAAFSSNNPPDVQYQIIPWMNKWRSTGVLQDLRKLDSSYVDKYLDGANEGYVTAGKGPKGEILGLPYVGGYWGVVLNEEVWEKAGKPPVPKTYDDMITFARAMTMDKKGRKLGESGFDARNVEHYGMTWSPLPSTQDNYLWNYFWAYGSDYINEEGTDIGFDNDAGRAALTHMKNLVTSGAVTPPNLYTDESRWGEAYASGKTGMAWTEGFTEEYAKKFPKTRIRVLDMPAGPAGQFVVGACGYLSVAAKSKAKDAAMDFVKHMLSDKPLQDFTVMILAKPIRAQSASYYDSLPDPRMKLYMNEMAKQAKYAKPTRILPYQPQEFLMGKINDFLLGRQSLDAMIKDASTQVKQMAKAAK